MPTLAELAGIAPPKPIDGISFVPTLKGKKQERAHRYLYFELGNKRYVVRGEGETRSDAEIGAEASTKVVVPTFEKPCAAESNGVVPLVHTDDTI